MSTEHQSRSRVVVTSQGDQFRATVTPDKTLVLTCIDDPSKRKGLKIGPITISGLDVEELLRFTDPGNDKPDAGDPLVMYYIGALVPLAGLGEAYFNYLAAKQNAKRRDCQPVEQTGTTEVEVKGVKIKTTTITTIGCPT